MSIYSVSHLLPSRCVWVEMHKPQCGGSELSNEWNLQLKVQSGRKGSQSICVVSPSVFTCAAFLNEPQLCFVVLFPPLQWSPLILNPSYTILHFLGATKVVSQHGVWFWRARFYQWSGQHALTSLHRPAYHFETCVCCFKAAQVHSSLFTVETLPTTLSCLLWAGNSRASLVVNGRLPSSQSRLDETCMA